MTAAARYVFAALVVATFGAFFVAQRLKNSPSVIQSVKFNDVFSPNSDGRKDRVRFSLTLKEADRVTLTIVDADGDAVRTLVDDRRLKAYERLGLPGIPWDGTDDDGATVPDGRYKLRITLRDQGRSVAVPRSILKDTKPPSPKLYAMGPAPGEVAEILPRRDGQPAIARFREAVPAGASRRPRALVFRTAPGTPRLVREEPLAAGATEFEFDGTNGAGRRLRAGTYVVAVQWRDQAGNVGSSIPLGDDGLPLLRSPRLPGRGGVTLRYLAVQAPSVPVKARDKATFFVDARGERYSWSIRRIGQPRPRKRGRGTRVSVTVEMPGGISGGYLFEVRTATRRTAVPFAVQARRPVAGTVKRPRNVLVVLPYLTWQGRNPVDDEGDGTPNTLDRGASSRQNRPLVDGLPPGFATREALLLRFLDATGRRYDLTTDLALAKGEGPQLDGHKGVLLAGETRWLPASVRARLRRFARRGGTVVSLGTDSLRRSVGLSPGGRMVNPSPPRATDVFGATLRPVVRTPTNLTVFEEGELALFAGTDGLFEGIGAWEETARVGREANLAERAVTTEPGPEGKSVIVAADFGEGVVIRPGLPDFQSLLTTNPAITELMARLWTLLRR